MASLKAFEELSETCLSPTVPCGITNKQRVRKRLSPSNIPKTDVWKAAESCLPLPCRIAMERPVPRGKLNFNFWKKRRKLRWLSIRNSCWIYLLQEEEALVKYSCLPDLALEEKDVISTLPGTPSGFLKYQWLNGEGYQYFLGNSGKDWEEWGTTNCRDGEMVAETNTASSGRQTFLQKPVKNSG